MTRNALLWPVLTQVLLTLAMFIRLALLKARAVKQDGIDREKTALHPERWPDYVLQVSNNIRNQFETPVLFYILVACMLATGKFGTFAVVLAWIFVGSRLAHAVIHTGNNSIALRTPVFSVGVVALIAMVANTARLMLS